MITSTHDQLDNWVAALTIFTTGWGGYSGVRGYINRGWREARRLKEEQMHRTIMDLIDSKQTQFNRIDELKVAVSKCVTRELYDQLQHEITGRFDIVTANLSRQITDGFAQINSRIDRLNDERRG